MELGVIVLPTKLCKQQVYPMFDGQTTVVILVICRQVEDIRVTREGRCKAV